METIDIKRQLSELSPQTPWTHLFEFAPGVFSVTPENEKFFKKATGLKCVGDVLLQIAEMQVYGNSLVGKKVIDLACGEGGHSVQFAVKGAKVTGVEGRSLYIQRARFAAKVMGQENIKFIQGDVRSLDSKLGPFDIVIFSGILHHLGIDDFDGMIQELGRLTSDILLIYTHTSSELSINNHRLQGPKYTRSGVEGYLFREHKDDANAKQREQKVRASLDNTFSFWAKEEDIILALKSAGFSLILKTLSPHPFSGENQSYRPILVAKKLA